MRKIFTFVILLTFCALSTFAISLADLMLVADDGTFLGTFESEYSKNSIYNQYGTYGSPYTADSIFNKYGNYGSDYSQYSPFNKYANNGPWLMDRRGNYYGRLSINKYAQGVTDYSYKLAFQLKAIRDSM